MIRELNSSGAEGHEMLIFAVLIVVLVLTLVVAVVVRIVRDSRRWQRFRSLLQEWMAEREKRESS